MLIKKIAEIVGEANLRVRDEDKAPHLIEPRGAWQGKALAVALPQSTAEVSALVRLAADEELHIIPQGGGTGLVGGQIALDETRALVVNLSRMNKVRVVADSFIIAEAGCVLTSIHEAAAASVQGKKQFPLRLASEGSAQVGGLLATNAGGHHVLRYGMMRDLTLGLEAVFADGSVWNGLKTLPKDNSGYDLKNLLIGSEGTLAIITAAVLKLMPLDEESATAMVAVPSMAAAVALFQRAQEISFGRISAFELMSGQGIEFILRHFDKARLPFSKQSRDTYYVLIESAEPKKLELLLNKEQAVIAQSHAQAQSLWFLRENLSAVQKQEGASIKHDISVPLAAWAEFTDKALAQIEKAVPSTRPVIFGHIGDGNLHFNLSRPKEQSDESFLAQRRALNKIVYDLVLDYQGSISAEHGIGLLKQEELRQQKGEPALAKMRAIKAALDPNNILNPNKIFQLK